MKIKNGFLLKKVSSYYAIIAVGKASKDFKSVITLNDSAKVMWDALEKGADEKKVISALLSEYDVDEETAQRDARAFIEQMRKIGVIED